MESSITHLNNMIHSPCCKQSNKFGWVRDGQQLLFAHKLVLLTFLSTCVSKSPIFLHKHSSHWLDKLGHYRKLSSKSYLSFHRRIFWPTADDFFLQSCGLGSHFQQPRLQLGNSSRDSFRFGTCAGRRSRRRRSERLNFPTSRVQVSMI